MNPEQLDQIGKIIEKILESGQAQQVAEQYIRYKYFDSIVSGICVVTTIVFIVIGVAWVIKKADD